MSCSRQTERAGHCFLRYLFSSKRIRPIITIFLPLVFIALISTNAFAGSVNVSWNENDPIPDGYIIHIRADGSSYNYDAPAWVGSGTSCTVDGLITGTTYFMVVRAYAGALQSPDSDEISFEAKDTASDTAKSENTGSETETSVKALISAADSDATAESKTTTITASNIPNVTQFKAHLSN